PDRAADDVGLRLDGEAAEAAARQRLLSGPGERVAQRWRVGGERALDLHRRDDTDRAFEGYFARPAADAQLQPGAAASERGREIGERHARVDRLLVPDEAAGGAEGLGDRRPGE